MMGPPPGVPRGGNDKWKDPLPQNIREVPPYLKKIIGGTIHRMGYVFRIVWDTKKWILFVMMFMTLYDGIAPVVHSLIHASLLNALADAIVNSIVKNIHNILNRISGELVTNKIKVAIIEKAKEVDLASFDNPEFYERLENANREAGNRPIHKIGRASCRERV